MALIVQDVIARAGDLLMDVALKRWTLAERVRWGNDAMGAILNRKPSAFATREIVSLVAGTYQTIPESGVVLLDVMRNIAANGATPGRAIRRTDRQLLDDSDPDWHTRDLKGQVRQFTFDDRAPKIFYVSPPAIDGTKVELMHAALPVPADENGSGTFAIGAEYMEAVVNYICYRAKAQDSEQGNATDAQAFYAAFQSALGEQGAAAVASSPNQPTNSV